MQRQTYTGGLRECGRLHRHAKGCFGQLRCGRRHIEKGRACQRGQGAERVPVAHGWGTAAAGCDGVCMDSPGAGVTHAEGVVGSGT